MHQAADARRRIAIRKPKTLQFRRRRRYPPSMALGFSRRLLSVLQLTRMALVFTAIADSLAATLIFASRSAAGDASYLTYLGPRQILTVMMISIGLYGYGMSLNDIIDRRRDSQIAADRPLPSGRIGLIAAHVICALLGLAALLAGAYLAQFRHAGWLCFVLLIWTAGLITFYDFAGKYLVAPGLLTLGLIRFFHATIPAPQLPLLWHPLLLLNHVTLISTIAYAWEDKRPTLTRVHWWAVLGGLGTVDATCIGLIWFRRHVRLGAGFSESLSISPGLILPIVAIIAFAVIGYLFRVKSSDIRTAGKRLMLFGLLWLIVYDASFVAGFVGWRPAVMLMLLLPIAYLCVLLMRWWAKLMLLSQRPEYQRAR
jgi:4-hydroxybenzoate polyprenyltransferase